MLKAVQDSKAFKYLMAFKELLGALLFIVSFIAAPLHPDLVTVIRQERLLVPIADAHQLDKKTKQVFEELSLITIEVTNRGDDLVQGVNLVVNGVEDHAISVGSSTSLSTLKSSPEFENVERISKQSFRLPGINVIPPHQNVVIQIAGRISKQLLFEPRVEITSSAKSSRVLHVVPIFGIVGFLYQNSVIFIALTFVLLVGVGLWRLNHKVTTD